MRSPTQIIANSNWHTCTNPRTGYSRPQSPSFLVYVVLKRRAQNHWFVTKPSGSGDENAPWPVPNACRKPYYPGVGRQLSQPRGVLIREQVRSDKPISMVRLTNEPAADSSSWNRFNSMFMREGACLFYLKVRNYKGSGLLSHLKSGFDSWGSWACIIYILHSHKLIWVSSLGPGSGKRRKNRRWRKKKSASEAIRKVVWGGEGMAELRRPFLLPRIPFGLLLSPIFILFDPVF